MGDLKTADHNQRQIDYFENNEKKTMVPRESNYLANHLNRLIDETGISKTDDILEIGCGMGRYTIPLLNRGYKVTGLDISEGLLTGLAKTAPAGTTIELICADIADLPEQADKKYDVVLGFFTLHHVHDLTLVFKAVRRVLKKGGKAVFLEPNPRNPLYYLQIAFTPGMRWSMERGLIRLTKSKVVSLLSETGFTDIELKRFGFFPPFVANTVIGPGFESALERIPLLKPILPFQIFSAVKDGI